MEDIMLLIGAANEHQRAIDDLDSDAVKRYWSIGDNYLRAAALPDNRVVIGADIVKVSSGAAFARAAGIPQSSVSRGSTIRKAFGTGAAASKAYMAQDKGFAEWVSSLVAKPSNRKGTGKKTAKKTAKPSVKAIAAEAKTLSRNERLELIALLVAMK